VDRAAEIPLEDVAEKDGVLHGQRTVEAELGPHPEDLAARRVGREQQRDGIARQSHDDEDDGGDEPEGDRGNEEGGRRGTEEVRAWSTGTEPGGSVPARRLTRGGT